MCTPKIEDGNNFGVQVQEEVLNEVRGVESESAAYMEQVRDQIPTSGYWLCTVFSKRIPSIPGNLTSTTTECLCLQVTRYHMNRARLVSKAAKYPHVEDYRRSITELDYRHFMTLRIILIEIRNSYVRN